jgi:hypothetical protein
VHVLAPDEDIVPATHVTHALDNAAPTADEEEPAAQLRQLEAPVIDWASNGASN